MLLPMVQGQLKGVPVEHHHSKYGTWTFKVRMSRPGILSQGASEAGTLVAAYTHGEPVLCHIRGGVSVEPEGLSFLHLLPGVS